MTGAGPTPPFAGALRGVTFLKALSFKACFAVKQEIPSRLTFHCHRVGGLETPGTARCRLSFGILQACGVGVC